MINTISDWRNEAISNGAQYLEAAANTVEHLYPAASDGEKAIAAASLAQTMAIDALATAVSGQAADTPLCVALARYSGEDV